MNSKGISPIVAVVLLIAISVISAIGVYFWVGGLATRQPTPSAPRTISAYMIDCNTSSTGNISRVVISNTSPAGTTAVTLVSHAEFSSYDGDNSNGLATTSGAYLYNCTVTSLNNGNTAACNLGCNGTALGGLGNCETGNGTAFRNGDGSVAIYGSDVASAMVTC